MNTYSLVLFLHIVGALGLFIGLGIEGMSLHRLRHAETAEEAIEWTRPVPAFRRLYPASMALLLVSGLYLTAVLGHVWWAVVALLAMIVMAAIAVTLTGTRLTTLARDVYAETGPLSPSLRLRLRSERLRISITLRVAVALGIIFLMSAKPGLTGSLLTVGVALVLGLAVSTLRWRTTRASAAEFDSIST